jgi:hypothetical protein
MPGCGRSLGLPPRKLRKRRESQKYDKLDQIYNIANGRCAKPPTRGFFYKTTKQNLARHLFAKICAPRVMRFLTCRRTGCASARC